MEKIIESGIEIKVKNAEGDPDTKATIIHQNNIDYEPKVSVIIPVYNTEEYLRECLDSVVNQTLKEIEIICVDDGSTDSSLEILKEYAQKDNRFTIITQKNLHAGVARNAGLAVARGEYLYFLDSDDFIKEEAFNKLFNQSQKYDTDIVLCLHDFYEADNVRINVGSLQIQKLRKYTTFSKHDFPDFILQTAVPNLCIKLFKTSFIRNNYIYFQATRTCNDLYFDCLTRLLAKKISYINESLATYRIGHSQCLTFNRGQFTNCLIESLTLLKNKMIEYELFEEHVVSFVDKAIGCFSYEFKFCNIKQRNSFIENFKKIIPDNYQYRLTEKLKQLQKVSVVIPIYNVEKYLKQCLDSIINQTLKEIEIICVNNGSTDNSLNILNEYAQKDNRILIINQNNEGPSVARNTGLKYCNSEFVYFIDSDDYIDINTIENLYKTLIKDNSDVAIGGIKCVGDMPDKYILDKQNWVNTFFSESGNFELGTFIRRDVIPTPWNKLYKMSIIKKYNLQFPEGLINEDEYWHWAYLVHCKTYSVDLKAKYYYFQRPDSIMANRDNTKGFLDRIDVYKEIYLMLLKYNLIEKYNDAFFECFRNCINCLITSLPISFYKDCLRKMESLNNECSGSEQINSFLATHIKQLKLSIQSLEYLGYIPKVSVIIPVYNTEKYLRDCIDSVINQTLDEIEIICIDDCSSDSSLDILKEYENKDKRIRVIALKENIRQGGARNRGLEIAAGKYVVFLDSDDRLKINSLEKLYDRAEKYKLEMLNFGGINYDPLTNEFNQIDCQKNSYVKDFSRVYHNNDVKKFISEISLCCRYLYNLSFLKHNKITFPERILFEDTLFVHRALVYVNTFGATDEVLYIRTLHKSQTTANWDVHFIDYINIVKMLSELFIKEYTKDNLYISLIENFIRGCISRFWSYDEKYQLNSIYHLHKTISDISKAVPLSDDIKQFLDTQEPIKFYMNYLTNWYKRVTQKELNLDSPRTFNEKIQWLKLYDSTPIKTKLADKYLVRDWVKEKIGEEYLIPLLGVYDNFDEIDFNKLPNQFVIKCNHGCGYNIIVQDKTNFDKEDAKVKINKWMSENFAFKFGYELHYSKIPRKIIIEKYIENSGNDLYDYKFWCFEGKVDYTQFLSERNTNGLKMAFYDRNWQKTKIYNNNQYDEKIVKKPDNYTKMLELAEKLSKDFNYVRVDFYRLDDGRIYFGEMTFTPASGAMLWCSEMVNRDLGNKIKLPKIAYNIDTGEYYKLPNYKFKHFLQKIFSIKNESIRKQHKILTIMGVKIKMRRKQKDEYSFVEKLFSVKNRESRDNKWYRVICILGLKFKFKNKELTQRKQLQSFEQRINHFCVQQENLMNQLLNTVETSIHKQTSNPNGLNQSSVQNMVAGMIKRIYPKPYLRNFIVDISHHCNLNCRGCDHFSPLAEEGFYDLEQYKNDIVRLSALTNGNIDRIGIMGGEPLLNPNVLEYLRITRQHFPETKIRLVTNGILLNKQNENFWLTLKELNIFIEYTKYDLKLDYDYIDSVVKKYEIPIDVYGYNQDIVKTSYKIPLDLKGNQDPITNFLKCSHANDCITLKNGKIYTCTVAPNIEHFNKYFGCNIPITERDGIDIYKVEKIEEILEFLAKPIPFCKYCNVKGRTFGHEWGVSKKEISEWT